MQPSNAFAITNEFFSVFVVDKTTSRSVSYTFIKMSNPTQSTIISTPMSTVPMMGGSTPGMVVDVHVHKSYTQHKVIAALLSILVLSLFIWMIIISWKPTWFVKNGQLDNMKTVAVSVGLAILIVVIIAIIMWAVNRNKHC